MVPSSLSKEVFPAAAGTDRSYALKRLIRPADIILVGVDRLGGTSLKG